VIASANLDLVRSIHAAWEVGDYSSSEWADPQIEWVFADGPSPGRWSGLDGMAQAFRQWGAAWEDFRIVADQYRELDDERVLVLVHLGGRGKTSRLELAQMRTSAAHLFHVRSGKVTRFVVYLDRERALADLGRSPE
jgi:ketosteroid isomerase-like protein